MMTAHETALMKDIEDRLRQVRGLLEKKEFPSIENTAGWYSYLAEIKAILGNSSNDVSFVATLMAKQYLSNRFGLEGFDAADKPQGAPGLDIDTRLSDGKRLIAEIKTTSPYKPSDLGAKQAEMFAKDFFKLTNTKADVKIFFLTESTTFELMKKPKYRSQLSGIFVVLLTTGEEFLA